MADFSDVFNDYNPEENNFSPVPSGSYNCELKKLERKDTHDSVEMRAQYRILDGEQKGRIIFDSFMLQGPAEKQKRIQVGRDRMYDLQFTLELVKCFDPDKFVGKKLTVIAAQNGKYTNVTQFAQAATVVESGDSDEVAPF